MALGARIGQTPLQDWTRWQELSPLNGFTRHPLGETHNSGVYLRHPYLILCNVVTCFLVLFVASISIESVSLYTLYGPAALK